MGKALIIVESPAKIKTLKKILGGKYLFESSVGHIRDLPKKEFGIDVENDFTPKYVNMEEKKDVIKKLKEASKKVDMVYLSPDPDREGEAIAWHISTILPKNTPIKRMTFNSITKDAVLNALKETRDIDMNLVNAQQARRLLDRIVGYKISPILSRKLRKGKAVSAGRVQSVALKLVVDREAEIDAFVSHEYWNIIGNFSNSEKNPFKATLFSIDGKKISNSKEEGYLIKNKKEAEKLLTKLEKTTYKISKVDKKEKKRNPVPPFITSTLQQEASRHYGFPVSRTMSIAQELYEGLDLKELGREGLITYMRTDSPHIAPEALSAAREFIQSAFGKEYLPQKPKQYSGKKSAQEAHEAIRPSNLEHTPSSVKKHLSADQYKIYLLIWNRFISSQMTPAVYDTITADIETDINMLFRTTGSQLKFKGFLAVYEEKKDTVSDEEELSLLPPLKKDMELDLLKLEPIQSFTKPPSRFTEASLVKELEKSGIGRPSTYASIMSKIQNREYTFKEKNTLKPTELGKIIAKMLENHFSAIMNIGFTAAMEDDLELIAEGKTNWKSLLQAFWEEFEPMVETAQKEATVPKIQTDIKCPKCGHFLQKIWSQNRYFYGCSNYPECDYTISIEEYEFKKEDYAEDFDWDQKCPKCGSEMNLRFGKFGAFLGCSNYPKCKGIVNIPKKGETGLKPEDRPACPALGCDGKIMMRRTRFGKIFYSCTNYPECDVIVNNLDDLEKKYDAHHPKTAYEKKARGSKAPYTLSDELKDLLKEEKLTRPEVIKKTWEYIKKHNLQDPSNRRKIIPDEKLAKVLKTDEPIDMMQLSGLLGKNLKKA